MAKWLDLYVWQGEYISDVFDISYNFDTYLNDVLCEFEKNDGTVEIYIRTSYDNNTWGDWIKLNLLPTRDTFSTYNSGMHSARFQYKVVLTKTGDVSPSFSRFENRLYGSYYVENTGDLICKPEVWIKKINGSGSVKLINESNGQVMQFSNLNNNEEVFVDCDNEDIVTDLPLTFRYKNHNNVFLELEIGDNRLTGEGDFELMVRHEFKTLQG